jgi:hypothetical protein
MKNEGTRQFDYSLAANGRELGAFAGRVEAGRAALIAELRL